MRFERLQHGVSIENVLAQRSASSIGRLDPTLATKACSPDAVASVNSILVAITLRAAVESD